MAFGLEMFEELKVDVGTQKFSDSTYYFISPGDFARITIVWYPYFLTTLENRLPECYVGVPHFYWKLTS